MMRTVTGRRRGFLWAILAVATLLGSLGTAGNLLANNSDQNGGSQRPPQVLPQGFESIDSLERDAERSAEKGSRYSAWIVESSRFLNVPFRAFMPDRGDKPTVDLPVNIGIIKGPNGKITLYDAGWKQLEYIYDWNTSCCWADLPKQMTNIGLNPNDVTRIIVGHGHWDHAGQLSSFPNATLYIQKEELRQIDFFTNYPTEYNGGRIRAVNTLDPITNTQVGPPQQACARTPVCGYPPQTLMEIYGKVLHKKAKVIDGRHEIEPGLIIHPAFRGHTYGSQLLQVNTLKGQFVFGSDTYSSWEGIRDWNVANIQQTDSVQQFLAYEKCYVLTSRLGGFNNCIAAHEPLSYTGGYPATENWWNIKEGNCSRAAELALATGQKSLVPADVKTGTTTINGKTVAWRLGADACRETVAVVPPHSIHP